MTVTTRATVLFWCQVGLYVTAMVTLLGILATFWFVLTSQLRTMEEDRARDRVMLQQHMSVLADHDRAREQHALAFAQRVKDHAALMERLSR